MHGDGARIPKWTNASPAMMCFCSQMLWHHTQVLVSLRILYLQTQDVGYQARSVLVQVCGGGGGVCRPHLYKGPLCVSELCDILVCMVGTLCNLLLVHIHMHCVYPVWPLLDLKPLVVRECTCKPGC